MLSFIPPDDMAGYENTFMHNSHTKRMDGKDWFYRVPTIQRILLATGLNQNNLALIWFLYYFICRNLCIKSSGGITFPEFAMAMFLCKSMSQGVSFGTTLPPHIDAEFNDAIRTYTNHTSPSLGFVNPLRNPVIPSNAHINRDWKISFEEKQRYDLIMKSADIDNLGYITGLAARQIFAQSGLHENMLAHIWGLADMQNRGKLNSDEFAVAMHLIYSKLNGHDLPSTLSPDLIPPSQRALSELSNIAKLNAMHQQPSRKISPSSSLIGISNVAANQTDHYSTGSITNNPEIEELRRQELLVQVEGKGNELVRLTNTTQKTLKSILELEEYFQNRKSDVLKAKRQVVELRRVSEFSKTSEFLTEAEISQFRNLEIEIPKLLQQCRVKCDQEASLKIAKLKSTESTSHSEGEVNNRAAALLAERMAALGVKTTVPIGVGPSALAPAAPTESLGSIELEKRKKLELFSEIENRFTIQASKIRSAISRRSLMHIKNASKDIELGMKVQSSVALELLQQLEGIEKQMISESLLPSLVQPVSHSPQPLTQNPASNSSIPVGRATDSANLMNVSGALGRPAPKIEAISNHSMGNPFARPQPDSAVLPTSSGFVLENLELTSRNANPQERVDVSGGLKSIFNDDVPVGPPFKEKPVKSSSLQTKRFPVSDSVVNPTQTHPISAGKLFGSITKQPPSPVSDQPLKIASISSAKSAVPASAPSVKVGAPPPPPPPPPISAEGVALVGKIPSSVASDLKRPVTANPKAPTLPVGGINFSEILASKVLKKVGTMNSPIQSNDLTQKVELKSTGGLDGPKVLRANGPGRIILPELQNHGDPFGTPGSNSIPTSSSVVETSQNGDWEMVEDSTTKETLYDVIVDFDFAGEGENDLPCKRGDRLTVEQEADEWLLCSNESFKVGWVPKSFTKRGDSFESVGSPEEPALTARLNIAAEVMFEFEARNPDELTCPQGSAVLILSKVEDEWWEIEYNGKTGLIPSTFLRETPEKDKGNEENQANQKRLSLNPFGSSALIFTPSASEFPELDTNITDSESAPDNPSQEESNLKEAILEMLKTERTYVEDLLVIKQHFISPLSQMNSVDMLLLFSNLLEIIEVNTLILQEFETAYASSYPFGEVYLRHLDHLQCYKTYCGNLDTASAYLQKKRTADPVLNNFLKVQQNIAPCKHLDLSSFLLVPMQRITRYSLLLRQIHHYTPKAHSDYDCSLIALQLSEEFLDHMNRDIKVRQSAVNIQRITAEVDLQLDETLSLDLSLPTKFVGPRQFLLEGVIQKNKSGRRLIGFLFSDFLLLAQPKQGGRKRLCLYRPPLMLEDIEVRDAVRVPNKETGILDASCFQIVFDSEVITLKAQNVSEKRQWVNHAQTAKKEIQTAKGLSPSRNNLNGEVESIGTLNVVLLSATNCLEPRLNQILAVGCLNTQVLKSKIVDADRPIFKQSLIFTVTSLDDNLQISLYEYRKYSEDRYLGQADIRLDFIEYYSGRATEVIKLPLKDGGYETISLKMKFKPK